VVFFLWETKDQIDSDIKYINGLLYNLDIEMDILEYSKQHYHDDKFLETKITHLIINKLLVLSKLNPPITKLDGIPLSSLNRLIIYNKISPLDFRIGDSDNVSQTIREYLIGIEGKVNNEIAKREKIFRDPLRKR
jgi:hypothetical protein